MRALKCCKGARGPCSKVSFPLICCRSWSDITEHPSLPMSQTPVYQHLEQKQWGQMLLAGRQSPGSDYTCQHKRAIIWDGDLQTESSWKVVIANLALFSYNNNVFLSPPVFPQLSVKSLPTLQGSGGMIQSNDSILPFSEVWP